VEQPIPFELNKYLTWCAGVSVEEYANSYSDYGPGFWISVYRVEKLARKTKPLVIPSTKYPYVNESIHFSDDEERYLLPVNYYGDPPYLLEHSIIFLRCKIDMPHSVDDLSYGIVHFFTSMDEASAYQRKEATVRPVYSINVTDCSRQACTKNYNITRDSFYFPVYSTRANSEYQITVNFTIQALQYVDPSNLSSAVNVANFSMNSSGEIPLRHSTVVLVYAHPPDDTTYKRLAHLNFSCIPNYAVRVPVYVLPLIVVLVVCFCWWHVRKCKNRRQADTDLFPTERTPLINSV
jgi:hypothetical protein